MERVFVGSSSRNSITIPAALPRVSSTGRLLGSLAAVNHRRRTVPPLRCMRSQEDVSNRYAKVTLNDDFINSAAVGEWESRKPINETAAKQGIRIRRRHGNPSESLKGDETPRNTLEKIIWDKKVEIAEFRQTKTLDVLKEAVEDLEPTRDFVGALREFYQLTGIPALIAEVKKASPSRGVLRENFDPVEVASSYERNGAACLRILTDKKYFQGGFKNLEAVRKAGIKTFNFHCPLLCKEFIIDSWQIYYARLKGADAVLLIAGVLPDLEIKCMTKICRELGLATLVEVHDEREMDRVLQIDRIQLIAINNRNLANTKKLLDGERGHIIRQKEIIVVGESGLFTPADISYVHQAGVRATADGIRFVLDNVEECFSQAVPYDGDRVHASFVVVKAAGSSSSWQHDAGVDLVVKGPNGHQIHDSRDKAIDKFDFVAQKNGLHQFCFVNKSPYRETIDFDVHVSHFMHSNPQLEDHFTPLFDQIEKLEEALDDIQFEQHWLAALTDRQALLNEEMSRRTVHKAILESAALVGVSVLQVFQLRRLFEQKLRT